ncbi:hypothetical protein AAC387_Pa03g1283 [Persea americana]
MFDEPKAILSWKQRLKIVRGVTTGLLYLHKEWEQVVIHHDVKARMADERDGSERWVREMEMGAGRGEMGQGLRGRDMQRDEGDGRWTRRDGPGTEREGDAER